MSFYNLNYNLNAQDLSPLSPTYNDQLNGNDRLLDYRLARKAFHTRDNAAQYLPLYARQSFHGDVSC